MIDYKDPKAVMRWLNGEDTEIEEDWLEGQIAELATACEYYVKVYLQERERADNILQALISTIKHTTCTETRDVLRCELEKLKGGGDND